jgi:polygalacturonase
MKKKYHKKILIIAFVLQSSLIFSQRVEYNIKDYGAKGDGTTMNTIAIQNAIDECHQNGGGVVVVPAGKYLSGPFYLKSNINLYLAPGSLIMGSGKLDDYRLELDGMIGNQKNTLGGINTGEKTISGESDRTGLVTAYNANNISITGQGIIDGNAMAFHDKNKMHWGKEGAAYEHTRQGDVYKDPEFALHDPLAHDERPGNLIRLINCVDARVKDVTFQNSPTWTFQVQSCENVTVSGIRVNSFDSDLRVPNDDGINIQSSTLVRISDSDIHTGDDCIANFNVKKLTVTNCTLSSRSSAIRVGDTRGDVEDLTFSNLIIYSANRAIGVYVRASGSVSNVLFSNIIIKNQLFTGHWWGQGEPIHVSALPSNFFGFEEKLGTISNVRFKNIIAETQNGTIVYGCEESVIKDVSFENVKLIINDSPINDQFGGNFDLRHTTEMEQALFAHEIPGIFTRFTDGLELTDFSVEWKDDLPVFFTNAIHCEEFNDLTIDGFKGQSRNPALHPSISLSNGKEVTIRNSKATKGTVNFLKHNNIEDYRLFGGNDLLNAKGAFVPSTTGFTMYGNIMPK